LSENSLISLSNSTHQIRIEKQTMKILVLGAGRMGLGAVCDLTRNSQVDAITVADFDLARSRAIVGLIRSDNVSVAEVDVTSRQDVIHLMRGHDSVISCVPYYHNLLLARAAIEAQVNFCDLGGNNAVVDAELALDAQAREAGVNIIPDCGLAPGMVSVLVAHGANRFDQLDEVYIRVGGLPQNPKPPLEYQLGFSVEGLINEYLGKARVLRGGELVEVDTMTEVESLEFPTFGQLEAFHTSGGSSTLPETFKGKVKELDYKTIRYPGHCEKFKLLIDLGFAEGDGVGLNGSHISPRQFLSEMLVRRLPAGEPDVVLIRIDFRGEIAGDRQTLRYEVIDRYDEETGLSAMMRTTAFPVSIIAQMMARGEIQEKGAIPQERCIPPDAFIAELAARDIRIAESVLDE
jgi:lysine 6-dehydrogenase